MPEEQHTGETDIASVVYAEQVRQLYKAYPLSILASFVGSVLLVAILWDVIPHSVLLGWWAAFAVVVVLRVVSLAYFRRSNEPRNYSFFGRLFVAGSAIAGISWGVAGVVFFLYEDAFYQVLMAYFISVLSAGSVSSHSSRLLPPVLFVCFSMVPLLISFLMLGTDIGYYMAVSMVIAILFLLAAARRTVNATYENIRLRIESENHEAELEASRQIAEQANKARSDFISRMSHELRTPLNAIMGFSQILDMDIGDRNKTHKQYIKEISNAGEHLLTLINDVLDLSKIDAGKVTITIETVEVAGLIADCRSLLNPMLKENGIVMHDDKVVNDYKVLADKVRLKQVLLNLMSNAIKYNKEGGDIFVEQRLTGDGCLEIVVRDTGHGMDPVELKKLFSDFERLGHDNSAIQGAGIGLVITRKLLEMMDGKILVDSQKEVGSSFKVILPLAGDTGEQ